MASNIFSKSVLDKTSGYTFKQFSEDVANNKDYRKMIQSEIDKANKRIKALDNAKIPSQALNILNEKGIDRFSIRGVKDIHELNRIYAQTMAFINNPTSLVTGAKQYIRHFAEEHNIDYDVAKQFIELREETTDYIYNLSNSEFYSIMKGYATEEEILLEKGFDGDVNDVVIELEQGLSEAHTMIVRKLNQLIEDFEKSIPDEINISIF